MDINKIIFIVLFAGLTLCRQFLTAQAVSYDEAIYAAVKVMQLESKSSVTTDSVSSVFMDTHDGNILMYEVGFADGSIVLLSGNKSCTPILCMIIAEEDGPSKGLLNRIDSMSPAARDLLSYYSNQINYIFNSANNSPKSEWLSILSSDTNGIMKADLRRVSPLIKTKWGQDESNDGNQSNAYNHETPGCGNYEHCPTGCVATAMAQILKYWDYPSLIPFKCSQYDWDNMPNKLNYLNNSNYTIERNAIAKLMHDCGILVNMDYCRQSQDTCKSSSSTSMYDYSEYAYQTHGFSEAIYIAKNNISDAVWGAMLRLNLDDGMPLQYRGDAGPWSTDGHSFVCDGYKNPLSSGYKYHFNWGWNGDSDGWFTIDSLASNIYPSFWFDQAAVFNIYPTDCWLNIIMECDKGFSSGVSRFYSAENDIRNNNHQYIVYNGASVQLQAGNEILLTNGFWAKEGSVFKAVIAPCPEPENLNSQIGREENNDLRTLAMDNDVETVHAPSLPGENQNVIVHPNPTDNVLHVSVTDGEIARVEMFDAFGRITMVGTLASPPSPTYTVDLSSLPSGVYVLRITLRDGGVRTTKVVRR